MNKRWTNLQLFIFHTLNFLKSPLSLTNFWYLKKKKGGINPSINYKSLPSQLIYKMILHKYLLNIGLKLEILILDQRFSPMRILSRQSMKLIDVWHTLLKFLSVFAILFHVLLILWLIVSWEYVLLWVYVLILLNFCMINTFGYPFSSHFHE